MAKKSNKSINEDSLRSRLISFYLTLKSDRIWAIFGLVILFFGICLMLASISFYITGGVDQSIVKNKSLWSLIATKENVENLLGGIGAFFAELLINRFSGLFSMTIPIFLILLGFNMMSFRYFNVLKAIGISFFFIIWGAIASAFILGKFEIETYINWGGNYGKYTSNALQSLIGNVGVLLLLFFSFIIFLMAISKKFHVALINMVGKKNEINDDNPNKAMQEENTNSKKEKLPSKNILKKMWLFIRNFAGSEESEKDNKTDEEDVENGRHDSNNGKQAQSEYNDQDEEGNEDYDVKGLAKTGDSQTTYNNDSFEVVIPQEEELMLDHEESPNKIQQKPPARQQYNDSGDSIQMEDYDPRADLSHFNFPGNSLLKVYDKGDRSIDYEEQKSNKTRIIETLQNYGIEITNIKATVGPTVTLYEIIPKAGIRISKIRNLDDDIALSLSALGIRIIAPMPGKGTIGIEVPNKEPEIVSMQSVIASKKFQEFKGELPVALGKTITNETFVFDLARLPHLLIAGATGQGKSVGLNAIITSLLYKKHPAELKMVLVDPKMVEFSLYSKIEKHYLAKLPGEEKPIITDVSKVTQTLTSLTIEMDMRYELLMKAGVRTIVEYNEKFKKRLLNPREGHSFLPYIVIVIDEFGDLIMTAGKEIEMPIARIAQKARAVGMHLIIATQRPTTNIITGTIKANFPARMAFRVMSQIDSRTILDASGANQLIGRGDLLFSQGSDLIRIQCAFVDTPEVQEITNFIGDQQGYSQAHELPEYVPDSSELAGSVDLNDKDPLFEEAARLIVVQQSGSTSLIQRKFSIGYNRAGRLMDQMEAAGIVGPAQGSKPREVFIIDEYSLEQKLSSLS